MNEKEQYFEDSSFYAMQLKHYSNLDMLRIIACLFVIIIHVMSGDLIDSSIDWQALTIHCIVADGVAIFFSITGFLWFRFDKSYKTILRNLCRRVIVPTIVAGVISQVLYKWINSNSWAFSIELLSRPNFKAIVNGLFQHNMGLWNNLSDIYWYVLEYAVICLWFPVIKTIVVSKNGERLIAGVIFWTSLNLLVRDAFYILHAIGINYSLYTYVPVPIPIIMVLLGYMMFKRIRDFSSKCPLVLSVFIYILLITFRVVFQSVLYKHNINQMVFVRYDCGLSIVTVFSLYLLIWKIDFSRYKLIRNILSFVSKQTFTIYLIHYMIIRKLKAIGAFEIIKTKTERVFSVFEVVLFDLIIASLVFSLSLFVSCILTLSLRKISSWCGKCKMNC